VGEKNAAKLSEAGLTVQGKPHVASPAGETKQTKAKGGAAKPGQPTERAKETRASTPSAE
jgi:hypothetical protein